MTKKSKFIETDTIEEDYYFDVFNDGSNRKVSRENVFAQIGKAIQKPFVYPTTEQLQSADLYADSTNPTYVRVESQQYRLYKITALAPTSNDIVLDNGFTASLQVEIGGDTTALTTYRGALVFQGDSGQIIQDGSSDGNTFTIMQYPGTTRDTDGISNGSTRMTVTPGVSEIEYKADVVFPANAATRIIAEVRKNGLALIPPVRAEEDGSGVTTVTLNLRSPTLSVVAGDYFEVAVWQNSGDSITTLPSSSWAELKYERWVETDESLPQLPVIDSPPLNQSVTEFDVITLTSVGSGQDIIQWRRNGADIAGANSANYTFTASLNDAGATYTVAYIATDVGEVTATMTLSVAAIPPPVVIPDQTLFLSDGVTQTITLGPLQDSLGNNIDYTTTADGSATISDTANENQITFINNVKEAVTISVSGNNGQGDSDTATITVTTASLAATTEFSATQGTTFSAGAIPTALTNASYLKIYGPDDAVVSIADGSVSWDIPAGMPSRSLHMGIAIQSQSGYEEYNYIIHVGVANVWRIGADLDADFQTWAEAQSQISSGDTVIINNGEYTGPDFTIGRTETGSANESNQYGPSGTATAFTTIMAENPGNVIFQGSAGVNVDLYTSGEFAYFAISGIFAKGEGRFRLLGSGQAGFEGLRPNNIMFTYCMSEGNNENEPYYFSRATNILAESCAAWGGGRYKMTSFRSDGIIYRRCVARYDRSNNPDGNPKGSFILYNSINCERQNCIEVDSDQEQFINSGEPIGAYGSPVTVGDTSLNDNRCVILNNRNAVGNWDMQVSNGGGVTLAEVRDLCAYDIESNTVLIYAWGAVLFDNMTLSNVTNRFAVRDFVHTFNGSYFRGVSNSILNDIKPVESADTWFFRDIRVNESISVGHGGEISNVTVAQVGLKDNNISEVPVGPTEIFDGLINTGISNPPVDAITGTTENDPIWHRDTNPTGGLRYMIRVEEDSNVEGKGGNALALYGKSGTFFGDPGYVDEPGIDMWPFPCERMFREAMKAYTFTGPTFSGSNAYSRVQQADATQTGDRGFCADDETLSNYIWAAMGNTVPPMGVTVEPGDSQATVRWLPHAEIAKSTLTKYTIYTVNPSTGAFENGVDVGTAFLSGTITGLNNGFNTTVVVTATDSVKGESSYSYKRIVVPNGTITQVPIIDVQPSNAAVVEGGSVTFVSAGQGAESIQWKKNGSAITGATSASYTFTPQLSDDGALFVADYTNTIGTTSTSAATLAVEQFDTSAPVVSISITGDTLTANVTDNIAATTTLQLIVDGSDTGAEVVTTSGVANTTFDLTAYISVPAVYSIQVRATDNQSNSATSTAASYEFGTPIFADDFTSTANWTGSITVSGGEGTAGGSIRTNGNIFNNAPFARITFDLKSSDTANETETASIYVGTTPANANTNSARIQFYPRVTNTNNNLWEYADGGGINLLTSFAAWGNTPRGYSSYEVIIVAATSGANGSVTINKDGGLLATFASSIQNITGGIRLDPHTAGDLIIKTLRAYDA